MISIVFVAGGVWLGLEGDWIGYLCSAFFGLGVAVFIVQLLPGASFLKISKDGFEFSAIYRRQYVKWDDIEEFGVFTHRHSGVTTNKMVSWNYVSDFDKSKVGRALSKGIAGAEAGLPDTYGLKAEKLLEIMTEYWTQYKETEPAISPQR